MNKELEVKVLNINKEKVENRLKEIGAQLVKKEYQINTIFDNKYSMIKNKHNGYLRIRETKDLLTDKTKFTLTLKKHDGISSEGIRQNKEFNTEIANEQSLINILTHLELDIKHKGMKERVSYKYENILFEIDTWDKDTYPYPYLEIEVKRNEDLDKAIQLLKLDRSKVTSKSLGELRAELKLKDELAYL